MLNKDKRGCCKTCEKRVTSMQEKGNLLNVLMTAIILHVIKALVLQYDTTVTIIMPKIDMENEIKTLTQGTDEAASTTREAWHV